MLKKYKIYEGNKPYVFISFCHKDKSKVYKIIEMFLNRGYRVWFDDGLHPGDDWPEVIAKHLSECDVCITLMSQNSVNSHNCRKEINFAFMQNKKLIGVELEKVEMPLGLQMQMSTIQYIKHETYSNVEDIFDNFEEMAILKNCINDTEVCNKTKYYFVRTSTSESIEITDADVKVGRSKARSNFVVLGNDTVGRYHALIKSVDGCIYIQDQKSLNKTYVNGNELKPYTDVKIKENDVVHLSDEEFIVIKKVEVC